MSDTLTQEIMAATTPAHYGYHSAGQPSKPWFRTTMKKQIHPAAKAYLIRGAFHLLLLLALSAIPIRSWRKSPSRGTTEGSVCQATGQRYLLFLSSAVAHLAHRPPGRFATPGGAADSSVRPVQ